MIPMYGQPIKLTLNICIAMLKIFISQIYVHWISNLGNE